MKKETKEAIAALVAREWDEELRYQAGQTVPNTEWLEDMIRITAELNLIGGGMDRMMAVMLKKEMNDTLFGSDSR